MTEIYDIGNFLRGEQFRLGIGGFYPSKIKRTFLVNLVTGFTYFITFGQVAAVMNFVFSSTDLKQISEVFLFSLTQVGFVNKLVNFHLRVDNAGKLDEILSQELFTKVTKDELKIFKERFGKVQKILNIFLFLCFAVVVLYGVFPAQETKKSETKNYPFPGKFPFDPDNYYFIIYIGEVVAVAVSAWNNGTLDCLFTKHTVIATTFFNILCEKIRGLLKPREEKYEESVEQRIKHCIIYYSEIINYVTMIESTFSYGILVQFLCSAVVICLTGFQLMLVASFESAQFGLLGVYFLCMTCQLLLYCWYGHMLMEESDGITKACYEFDWDEIGVTEQKMLITIMERAKRPVALKAAGIFKLNLSTLMAILRSSYSYFAVLRQIYNK